MLFKRAVLNVLLFALFIPAYAGVTHPNVSIVTDKTNGAPVTHALNKLISALTAKHISFEQVTSINNAHGQSVIVAGAATGAGDAAQLLKAAKYTVPKVAQALTIRKTNWRNKSVWVISGFDDTGIMYAILDVADKVHYAGSKNDPFIALKTITEKPAIPERAVFIYTMNRAYWESRFYNEAYWTRYLDMLAKDRFNMLTVIFGYENGGFLAPPYPYFFDVDGFPGVKMKGMTPQQQQRNLAAFNHIIQMAHERGIGVTAGIWDHIYRGGIQAGGSGVDTVSTNPVYATGLNGDNLIAYTKPALAKFIKLMPGLDAINFRMHDESGLKKGEQRNFWLNLFKSIKATTPNLRLVLRAKGLSDSTIQDAVDVGVKFTISTKYWMEQVGLPYHPTHVNRENQKDRRHGYADMLKYPEQYKLTWGLWTGGTTRILLWADPDYAKRFVNSLDIYDSYGFDVAEPLATKMESQPHDAVPFELLKKPYQYYDWEFERYWHFFEVFGRIGYNPNTSPHLWDNEFEQHFGKKAAPVVEAALHTASAILPRIVATSYPYSYFPTTRGWAEKQRIGDLPTYAKNESTDVQQFAGFDEEARLLINGGETTKILPSMNSLWFAQASDNLNKLIADAEKETGANRSKEFNSTMVDLKILSNLALYHSRRIPAGVYYCLWQRTQDVAALDSAIANEKNAIAAWQQIVDAAGDVYADDIKMGLNHTSNEGAKMEITGNWKTELASLKTDLKALEDKRNNIKPGSLAKPAPHYKPATVTYNGQFFKIDHTPVISSKAGNAIKLTAKITGDAGIKWARIRYRSVDQYEDYKTLDMKPTAQKDIYTATIPVDQINTTYNLQYFIEVMDSKSRGVIYPDLNKETPYIVVKLDR
ncbi:MAG: hypothetical protein ABI367_07870 [Mucilaginibacter sp.]